MRASEILSEAASKLSLINQLLAVKEGEKPDDKLVAKLQRLCDSAEKIMMRHVLANPDNFGIDTYETSAREIRSGTHIWAQRVHVFENGFLVDLNVDTDDIGGDSTNHEQVGFDAGGKEAQGDRFSDQDVAVAVFDVQEDFIREE